MKRSTRFSLLLAGAIAVLPMTGLFAQDPAATPSVSAPAAGPSADAGQGSGKAHRKSALAALSPDERKELKAAHEKAKSDPSVQAIDRSDKKAYRKAVREAMLKADPNIQPILEKMHGNKMHKKDLQTT